MSRVNKGSGPKFVPAGNAGKPGKAVKASKGKMASGAASTKKAIRVAGNKPVPAKAKKQAAKGSALVKKNVNNAVGSVKRKASRGRKSK